MVQFLKDFGPLIGAAVAIIVATTMIIFHFVMKKRDEWKFGICTHSVKILGFIRSRQALPSAMGLLCV